MSKSVLESLQETDPEGEGSAPKAENIFISPSLETWTSIQLLTEK